MRSKDLAIDLFGDYIRYEGGSIRLSELTQLLEVFDIPPATARVTLARMRRDGWLAAERNGRESIYAATPRLLRVLDDGWERIFAPSRMPWSGQWTIVIYQIPESERHHREKLKRTLAWEGFGQLNPTVWLAPHDIREQMRHELGLRKDGAIQVFTMSTGDVTRDRQLTAQCWDLETLGAGYKQFIKQWGPQLDSEPSSNAEALRLRVTLVWEYRRFLFQDPNLPWELQPHGWAGSEAYAIFVRLHQQLAPAANRFVSTTIGGRRGPKCNT